MTASRSTWPDTRSGAPAARAMRPRIGTSARVPGPNRTANLGSPKTASTSAIKAARSTSVHSAAARSRCRRAASARRSGASSGNDCIRRCASRPRSSALRSGSALARAIEIAGFNALDGESAGDPTGAASMVRESQAGISIGSGAGRDGGRIGIPPAIFRQRRIL